MSYDDFSAPSRGFAPVDDRAVFNATYEREFQPDPWVPSDDTPASKAVTPSKIFNSEKTDYENTPLFFGQDPGLLDTVNKKHPKLMELFRNLRSLDWADNEFDFSSCVVDFQTADPASYSFMIKTLLWQWEADSMASRSIATILGNVVTDSELWLNVVKINENENIHALTYSEIVRNSFPNPDTALKEILEIKEAMERLVAVAEIMKEAHRVSHMYALGMIEADQDAYNAIFMFMVAMYFLERIQFMASFSVTFAICRLGKFQPIGKAVERIAQDEYEIHAQFGQEVLRHELTTERGKLAYKHCMPKIIALWKEVVGSELGWMDYLYEDGHELPGYSQKKGKEWIMFNAAVPAKFLGFYDQIEADYHFPTSNPLVFMEDYLDVSASQAAPQEEDAAAYRVNVMKRTDDEEDFEFDL